MADDNLVNELDRNMDTVFDSLYVLNATMNAVVQSLQPQAATHVMRRLDEALDGMDYETNPPARFHRLVMNGWRNMAAQIAGSQTRQI